MNIYVSNLANYMKDQDVQDLFASFGAISSCKVILDRYTGASRGFAFVEMPGDEEGRAAIDQLNGKVIDGKALSVAVAKEREDRSFGGNRNSRY
ncbi:RNA recognition motif domain-containing protein [Chitinophaga alhagiae]|uniref:RNA recognition motif domain-containing protein n=1 Tax=Chitinophaga alhagiae TaxID=2203219 RepID=UPI000E5A6442|nr:RNA-binding protein [Chitinophaga alhagiae]